MAFALPENIALPVPPNPVGSYERGIILNRLGFVSGQFPLVNGALAYTGRIGAELTEEQGVEAARIAAINVVSQIDCLLGKRWDRFSGLLRVDGYVASSGDWSRQIVVLNAASEVFLHWLGEKGEHARAAFLVTRLPLNAPIELVVSFATNS
jgi:enamine deaminase RidA (YjgF/YER057c/UK114 family)